MNPVMMHQRRRYPTLSLYEGLFDTARQCMEGYGRYIYPDGSEYRGYFLDGQFHGYGNLRLAAPHKCTIRGLFVKGRITYIENIGFSDGLQIATHFYDISNMNFSVWNYLNDEDRRYLYEKSSGLQATNPNAEITSQRSARPLPAGAYDFEEGFYRPFSGFVTDRPTGFPPLKYIACNKERQWIMDNCRVGGEPVQISEKLKKFFGRKILNTNWLNEDYLDSFAGERSTATGTGGHNLRNLREKEKRGDENDFCKCEESSMKVAEDSDKSEISNIVEGSSETIFSFDVPEFSESTAYLCACKGIDLRLKGTSLLTAKPKRL